MSRRESTLSGYQLFRISIGFLLESTTRLVTAVATIVPLLLWSALTAIAGPDPSLGSLGVSLVAHGAAGVILAAGARKLMHVVWRIECRPGQIILAADLFAALSASLEIHLRGRSHAYAIPV